MRADAAYMRADAAYMRTWADPLAYMRADAAYMRTADAAYMRMQLDRPIYAHTRGRDVARSGLCSPHTLRSVHGLCRVSWAP